MDFALSVVTWIILVLAIVGIILAAIRFLTLRSRGTAVLVRVLPAEGVHGWRHGVLRYNGDEVEFFKLRSVSPSADLRFNRLDIELLGHRTISDAEASFMSDAMRAVHIEVKGKEYEICCDTHGEMALSAWIESAPSKRAERSNYHRLRENASRPRPTGKSDGTHQWPGSHEGR